MTYRVAVSSKNAICIVRACTWVRKEGVDIGQVGISRVANSVHKELLVAKVAGITILFQPCCRDWVDWLFEKEISTALNYAGSEL
jgi:hypothetical protein